MPSNDLGIWDGAPESRSILATFPKQRLHSTLSQLLISSGSSSIFTPLPPAAVCYWVRLLAGHIGTAYFGQEAIYGVL